jgi:hypothetical protein
VIIEYSNAKEPKSHASLSVVIVVASCAFFFIPTTLIVLGYLASQPTGTLISPLPQGTLSQNYIAPSPTPLAVTVTPAPTLAPIEQPIIAAPNESTSSSDNNVTPVGGSNIIDHTASVSANLTEIIVSDPDIKAQSQIYLSPRPEDKAVYSVKSKTDGQMTMQVNQASDTVRYVDYHIVNP